MSSKENAAINQLFERLECRYALRVLWALKDGHPRPSACCRTAWGGITPNTLNTRIKELREAGFVDHGSDGYTVTPLGRRPAQAPVGRAGLRHPLGRWPRQKSLTPNSPSLPHSGKSPAGPPRGAFVKIGVKNAASA